MTKRAAAKPANLERLFRPAAINRRAQAEQECDLLRIVGRWARLTMRLVLISALTVIVFVCVVPVREYASGPAVVRMEGRRVVTSLLPGTIENVIVRVI